MPSYVLGISALYHDAAACLLRDGEVATRLGLAAVPPFAETIALDRIFALARATGSRVHLARLSTQEGVALGAGGGVRGHNLDRIGAAWLGLGIDGPLVPERLGLVLPRHQMTVRLG